MNLYQLNNGEKIDLIFAEKVIKENCKIIVKKNGKKKTELFGGLTTSKLRNLLDYLVNIYTKVYNSSSSELSEEVCDELEYLKVKFAYESGREESVEQFVKKTHVREIVDTVIKKKSKKVFLDYCKYFEALVAYAKFYNKED